VVVNVELYEICRWESGESGNDAKSCRCEGVAVPEDCGGLNVTSPSDCNVVLPNKNNDECFFNKFSYENGEIIECTDVDVVGKCGDILNSRSCNMARRIRFPYLESSLTIPSTIFICLWDEVKQECILKELVKAVEDEKETSIVFIVIIGVVICGCVVLSVVVIVVILVLRRRMRRSSQENECEMNDVPSSVDKGDSKDHTSSTLFGFIHIFIRQIFVFLIFFEIILYPS
jgi:hypothetical protein